MTRDERQPCAVGLDRDNPRVMAPPGRSHGESTGQAKDGRAPRTLDATSYPRQLVDEALAVQAQLPTTETYALRTRRFLYNLD